MADTTEKKVRAPRKPKETSETPQAPAATGADASQSNSDLPFTPAEHIPQEQPAATTAVAVLSIEQVVNRDVAKLDMNKQKISVWKRQFASLTISGVNDKEGHKKVKEAKAILRSARTAVEGKRKEIKADYIAIGKGIDAAANEYTTLIEEIEANIDAQLTAYDKLKKDDDEAKEKEAARVLNERVDALKESGMAFDGSFYSIGDNIAMGLDAIKGMKDGDFMALNEKVKLEKIRLDKVAAEAAEAKRLEDEKQAQVKADQEKKAAEQKKIEDEQEAERKRLAKEAEDMRREKLQMREQMAHNAGLSFNPTSMAYEFSNKYTAAPISITKDSMVAMESAAFSKFIADSSFLVTTAKNNADAAEKKEKQKNEMIAGRLQKLAELGMTKQGAWYTYKESTVTADAEFQEMTEAAWETHVKALVADISEVDAKKKADEEKAELLKTRRAQIYLMGMEGDADRFYYPDNKDIYLMPELLGTAIPENWDSIVADTKAAIDKYKADQVLIKQQQQDLFDARCNELIGLGMKKEGVFFFYRQPMVEQSCSVDTRIINAELTDVLWEQIFTDAEGKIASIDKSFNTEKERIEAEKQAALPEAQKIRDYIVAVQAIQKPEIKIQELKNISVVLDSDMEAVLTNVLNALSELEK